MSSNRALVDNFLNDNPALSPSVTSLSHHNNNNSNNFSPTDSNVRCLSPLDSSGDAQRKDCSANASSPAHILALQHRLFALISEAQGIITQLQHYGCFPKMPQAPSASQATNFADGQTHSEPLGFSASLSYNSNADPLLMLPKYQPQSSSPKPMLSETQSADPYTDNSPVDSPALWASVGMGGATSSQNNHVVNSKIDVNNAIRGVSAAQNTTHWDGAEIATGKEYTNETQSIKILPMASAIAGNQSTNAYESELEEAFEGKSGPNHGMGSAVSKEPVVYVEFKRKRIHKYVCHDPNIYPGVYVLVDGDRGTDCGLVTRVVRWFPNGEPDIASMDDCDIEEQKIKPGNGFVLRQATIDELDKLHNVLSNAENVALKTCRQRCQELGIDIKLIDVEYQFDMKKVSFFYDSDRSVDFRALVRELYRTFGARIWMENVNPKVKNCMPADGGVCSPSCSTTREAEPGSNSRHSHNSHRRN